MICRHKLNHFTVANTRFTAPLTRRGKTKFATIKWFNLCLQIIQSQTCYPLNHFIWNSNYLVDWKYTKINQNFRHNFTKTCIFGYNFMLTIIIIPLRNSQAAHCQYSQAAHCLYLCAINLEREINHCHCHCQYFYTV